MGVNVNGGEGSALAAESCRIEVEAYGINNSKKN